MPQLSTMSRNLDGDGSHRRVMSSMTIGIPFDGKMKLDAYDCNIVLIESLPVGVFADSFELLRLVSKKGNLFSFTSLSLYFFLVISNMLLFQCSEMLLFLEIRIWNCLLLFPIGRQLSFI